MAERAPLSSLGTSIRLITTVTGGSHQGMDTRPEFPYDDRSPTDGELFSIEALYWKLPIPERFAHAESMGEVIITEREVISFVDRELQAREKDFYETDDEKYRLWRYYVAREMSDEELVQERMRAQDRIFRALGAMAIGFRTGPYLVHRWTTLPPSDAW